MKVSLAQINSTIGDFDGNCEKILSFAKRARDEQKADLVLFPELALSGCPPMDLLESDFFIELGIRAVHRLEKELPPDLAVGCGYAGWSPYNSGKKPGKRIANVYGIFNKGELVFEQIKTLLPCSGAFNEEKYFEPARHWDVFEFKGERIGFALSEDFWQETDACGNSRVKNPARELLNLGVSLICVPSASPYEMEKFERRLPLASEISRSQNLSIIYINAVGANDGLVFDGRSFVFASRPEPEAEGRASPPAKGKKPLDEASTLALCAKAFEEDLALWDSAAVQKPVDIPGTKTIGIVNSSLASFDPFAVHSPEYELDMLEEALVCGIRDYMKKCGFSRAHLGLSGGIDSALVAYLAVRAAGAENTACLSMPSRFSSQGSKDDAAELAANLGCRYETIPIEDIFSSFLSSLKNVFEDRPFDLAEENLQARIRGTLLMAYSNKFASMLLSTGNKSEAAMGYCTLYGDTCGALDPIGDLLKTEIFALCRRINERSIAANGKEIIPQAIIDKPPSAELRPDQKDEDSLPPYEMLDEILRFYLYDNHSRVEIINTDHDAKVVDRIIKTIAQTEFKRHQLPPLLKVSPCAFGIDRSPPLARFVHELKTPDPHNAR